MSKRWYTETLERQDHEPVKLHEFDGRTWWWFRKTVYVERERLSAEDVKALALQLQRGKNPRALEVAHAEMRGEFAAVRPANPSLSSSDTRYGVAIWVAALTASREAWVRSHHPLERRRFEHGA